MNTSVQENTIQDTNDLLAWASKHPVKTEQLAYDITRLMQVTDDRLQEVQNKPFFKRVWSHIAGEMSYQLVETSSQLLELQNKAQHRLLELQNHQLLTAETIICVQNNLNTLAVKQGKTQEQITLIAERVRERFLEMENRIGIMEVNSRIHSWLLTLETYDYDERFPPSLRLLKVIQDFVKIKGHDWNLQEVKFLQKALKEVGLPWKEKLSTEDFINQLVDDIESHSFATFKSLLPVSSHEVSTDFINDNVSVATFSAIYQIADKYENSAYTIEALQGAMDLTRAEAIKLVLKAFVKKQGVDLAISIPLKDLAIEILSCSALTQALINAEELTPCNHSKKKTTSG